MDNVRQLPHPQAADEWDVPARDLPAERAVIGAAINSAAALDEVAAFPLEPRDFSDNRHRQLYAQLLRMRRNGDPIEFAAVCGELARSGLMASVGGINYVHDLARVGEAVTSVLWYATVVRDDARLYRVDQLALRARQIVAQRSANSIEQILADFRSELDSAEADVVLDVPKAAHPWAPYDLTDVVAGQHLNPPGQYLARDDGVCLLYPGKIHSVSGESESGKTWLLLLAAAQVIGAGGTVLYLDFEDSPEGIVGRLRALGLPAELILQGLRYCRPDTPIDDTARSVIKTIVDRDAPGLCVVDGVTEAMTLHGWNPLDNQDAAKFYVAVPRFVAKLGPAVAMIDHVVKDPERRGRYGIGAQHKLAGIDGAAYIVAPVKPFGRGKHGISRVTVSKDRPGRVREHTVGTVIGDLQMISEADGGVRVELRSPRPYDGPGAEAGPATRQRPTSVMEQISRILEDNRAGLSKAAIEGLVTGKREVIRAALELLIGEGCIEVTSGGRGAMVHRSVRAFREAADAL